MAAAKSLGVHVPVALPHLVAEGLLPHDPKTDLYRWETYVTEDDGGQVEEEVVATKNAVVWSQGKFVRNIYRFDLEGEGVIQAVLTRFPTSSQPKFQDQVISGTTRTPRKRPRLSTSLTASQRNDSGSPPEETLARALVVLLKTKAHIYFLHGASHIVDLPFDVERAFAAPRGLVLQRKRTSVSSVPLTPQAPKAPPNSFFSSQLQSSQSHTHPQAVRSNFEYTKPPQPKPLRGDSKLDALFQSVIAAPGNHNDEDVTNLYSLTSPLSDIGVVTYSLQHHKPRISSKSQGGLSVEFEGLDPAEKVIYVSAGDEMSRYRAKNHTPLTLLVTINQDMGTVSVYHAWYMDDKSLLVLLKQRANHKAAKSRRRSSFLSASLGTGTATPAVRQREKARESFAGAGLLHAQGEHSGSQSNPLFRKPTRQEEEEAMASQMDPDYQPTGTQPPTRENRRISSINTDVRASQSTVSASFAGTGGRRATSFGVDHGRRSLSHRKSRGSTPGSAFGQSLGVDDDTMDLDSTIEFDPEESLDGILRHIRATYDVSGLDSVFGSAEEGFKRELVVRKIHSFAVALRTSGRDSIDSLVNSYSIVTLTESPSINGTDDPRLRVYLHDRETNELQYVAMKVKYRQLWPEVPKSPLIAIPLLTGETQLDSCEAILKLSDGHVHVILLEGRGLQFSMDDQSPCPLPSAQLYRVYDKFNFIQHGDEAKEIGRNRTLQPPSRPICLQHAGPRGAFDEVASDGIHHRRQLRLQPSNPKLKQLLTLCELMLPKQQARSVQKTWCMAYAWLSVHPEVLAGTRSDKEFAALVTTMVVPILGILDSKARATINMAKMAIGIGNTATANTFKLRKKQDESDILTSSAWSWMPQARPTSSYLSPKSQEAQKDQLILVAAATADELLSSTLGDLQLGEWAAVLAALRLMIGLHVFREELTMCTLSIDHELRGNLAPVVAQLGQWLGLQDWGFTSSRYYATEGATGESWAFVRSTITSAPQLRVLERPISALQWIEESLSTNSMEKFPSLYTIAQMGSDVVVPKVSKSAANGLTPRLSALADLLAATVGLTTSPMRTVELLARMQLTTEGLETLPQSIAAPFKEAIARCEKDPPTIWRSELLQLVGRADLKSKSEDDPNSTPRSQPVVIAHSRDVQAICGALDQPNMHAKSKEAGRHAVSQLIFSEDRRLVEAIGLMHFNSVQVAQCPKQPDWDEQVHFDHQKRLMHHVTTRMIALPAGDGMIHYDSQTPLLTEKYHLPGFNSSCIMQPMGHTLTADRSGLTEENVNWAYFHAGVSAGLRVSRYVKGIDTSWIAFNKPNDLTNRHAGLLLALGLGGHLRHLAKWLSFKYLTAKHTMTSVGLLLGLSASHIGTMDSLITRMLSVHITKMLPPGAAELNVSPATQTAGLMGIGLLYYNTQHRRMSEVMLSEIEHMEMEDPDSGPDPLRDESYRLAAGFALGFINLGRGGDLRGLHGMHLTSRLLSMAVGSRPVNAVHVFDRATAGAVMALALVFMKSGDQAVARKVDIPDTEAQFDHVRPDILMLRAMAKNVILWDNIEARGPTYDQGWIQDNLPACYKTRSKQVLESMLAKRTIDSAYIPLFNVFTGLGWALGLRYAGSANTLARDEILSLLKFFHTLSGGADAFYFDGKLGRSSLRRCMDVLALAAATVMAGTGDLETFRYLRRMHGRVDQDTPYGSHMAAHLAIGVLFLAGGTFTFSTSDLAIASLMVAFYPIFPIDVSDNRVHLQAFRHLWVLAAEARCIVIEDIDTQRPIHLPIKVTLHSGEIMNMRAPCLLPELESIDTIQTDDPGYWRVTLDFAGNPQHLTNFRQDQRVSVRRCPAAEAHDSVFSAALAALTDMSLTAQPSTGNQGLWHRLLSLPAFEGLDRADIELLLPPDVHSSVYSDDRTTVIDDRLVLLNSVRSHRKADLWNLRVLFAWAERMREAKESGKEKEKEKETMKWLGEEVIEELKAGIEERVRGAYIGCL